MIFKKGTTVLTRLESKIDMLLSGQGMKKMAYMVMAYIFMAHTVTAYLVMASRARLTCSSGAKVPVVNVDQQCHNYIGRNYMSMWSNSAITL